MKSDRIELSLPSSKDGIIPIDQDSENIFSNQRGGFEPQNQYLLRMHLLMGQSNLFDIDLLLSYKRKHFVHQRVINALGWSIVS